MKYLRQYIRLILEHKIEKSQTALDGIAMKKQWAAKANQMMEALRTLHR
jgi:hypothetical protein